MNAKLPAPRLVVGTGARPFVEIRKVEKTYLGRGAGLKAVDGFTLDLAAGEFLSIVGPSGCGKSTLMMMVAGLAPVTAGEIVIQGQRISGPHTDIGVIFQRDALLEWRTVLNNVLLQIDIRRLTAAATSRWRATCWRAPASPASRSTIHGSCRAGCASAYRCAAPWCTIRPCC